MFLGLEGICNLEENYCIQCGCNIKYTKRNIVNENMESLLLQYFCLHSRLYTGMRRITTFRSTDRIYDGGTIILYYNIIILTVVLQLPTVFSTVTCCTGL